MRLISWWASSALCLRRERGASAHAAPGICAGCLYAIQDHLHGAGADGAEEFGARSARQKFAVLPPLKRRILQRLDRAQSCARRAAVPNVRLSRMLLQHIHQAFGGELRALFVGGAFTDLPRCSSSTISAFRLSTATVSPRPAPRSRSTISNHFAPTLWASRCPGIEVRIADPGADGIGEVAVRSKTVMSHYLDDPEMTSETIVDGWLMTGDLGRFDRTRPFAALRPQEEHDRHRRRKNIYPEDIENFRRSAGEGVSCLRRITLARKEYGASETLSPGPCAWSRTR